LRDVQALTRAHGYGQNFNFDFDDHAISLFNEDANRAMLGVSTKDSDDDKVKGAEVTSISKESAAEKAGLKKGDIITRIGNEKIEDANDVSEAIKEHKPGDKVAVTVLRDGKEQKLNAELTKWKGVNITSVQSLPRVMAPSVWGPATPGSPNMSEAIIYNSGQPRLGLSIQDTEDGKGVKVLRVADESNAAKAGVEEDDIITHINDKAVNTADEVSKLVKEAKDKASFTMKVKRDGKTHNLEVRTPRRLKTTNL
jgi:serine protease Do